MYNIYMYVRTCFEEVVCVCVFDQDTGVSVRKRVIKILKDICLLQPQFSRINETCVKMMRRISDEEEGIKVRIFKSE